MVPYLMDILMLLPFVSFFTTASKVILAFAIASCISFSWTGSIAMLKVETTIEALCVFLRVFCGSNGLSASTVFCLVRPVGSNFLCFCS